MLRALAIVLLALLSASALGAERVQICAKYRQQYGWSESYRVEATKTTGSELNSATGTWEYDGFSTYVVIFWGEGQATVIKMAWPYLSPMGSKGEDQRGVTWEVSTSSVCY